MQSLSRAFSTGKLNHFSPLTWSQIQILYSFKKVNASSGAYPKKIPNGTSKKFIQQIVRPWSFLRVPTIEANMNSSSLLLLTFPYTVLLYKPSQSSRNKILCSFWCILRQLWYRWLRSNTEDGRRCFEVTQRRASRQHFHNGTTDTPLGKKETNSLRPDLNNDLNQF